MLFFLDLPLWRSGSDNVERSYGYKYDAMNRLTNAIYGKPNNSVELTHNYNEWLSYDKNGNILTLGRNGISDSHNDLIQIDDLEYHYKDDNSNILIGVNDHSGNTAGFKKDQITAISETNPDYFYDDHGNLVADHTKEITNITYNHLNLPTKVTFHGTNKFIEYLYTATSQKVQCRALKKCHTVTKGSDVIVSPTFLKNKSPISEKILGFALSGERGIKFPIYTRSLQ